MDEKTQEKKGLSAKKASLIAKVVAGVIVVSGAVLKWTGVFQNCDINELCTVGFTIMGLFGTVDLNIALDKFTKKE
jgi:uncharacterized membrane protein